MDFNERCVTVFDTDLHKRVNYQYGLVLGVGEFRTEQNYFLEKVRSHLRSLHGYGTVAGLAVEVRDNPSNGRPEVHVSPGLAVDPHGNEICVPEAQCGMLDDWLQRPRPGDDGSPPILSTPEPVVAYLTLCYRKCETDPVPIPVGPCHSLDRTTVSSRIQDAFELRLVDTPPPQIEEAAMRAFIALLANVTIGSGPGAETTPDALVAAVRAIAGDGSPPLDTGSPPFAMLLHADFADEILHAAIRVYVTEIRPLLVPEGGGCLNGPRDLTCVLLARIEFDVIDNAGVLQVAGTAANVIVDQGNRPILLPSWLMQEGWLGNLSGAAYAALPASLPLVGPPMPLSGPAPLTLPLGSAIVVSGAVVNAPIGPGLPSLDLSRGSVTAFSFAPPAGWRADLPQRVRLRWSFTRGSVTTTRLRWDTELFALADGVALATATPAARARADLRVQALDFGNLQTTELSLGAVPGTRPQQLVVTLSPQLSAAADADGQLNLLGVEFDSSA